MIWDLPSGNLTLCDIEHGHRNSGFSPLENGGFFHSYVSLPRVWGNDMKWYLLGNMVDRTYLIIGPNMGVMWDLPSGKLT